MNEETFEKLQNLVGDWQEKGGDTKINYRMSAHNSILVETWQWPVKEIEALTIYFLDGDLLKATHYCPIGNQPTLILDTKVTDRLQFNFLSATNLENMNADHNRSFWFEIVNKKSFVRSETYMDKGLPLTKEKTYLRTN